MLSPRSLFAPCALLAACSLSAPVPKARVQRGPAFDNRPHSVFALPAVCGPDSITACQPEQTRALAHSVRMALEFDGYRIIDSERVNAYLRRRVETSVEWRPSGNAVEQSERTAGSWFQAPPRERQMMLEEMGVEALLETRIDLGPVENLDQERRLTLSISLIRPADGAAIWNTRCTVWTGGDYYLIDMALEVAGRCAVESRSFLRS